MKISGTWLFIFISIIVLLFIFIYRNKKTTEIQNSGVIVNVEITDILISAKGAGVFNFRCKFVYAGLAKELDSPTSIREHGRKYVGKHCPALYSPKNDDLRVLLRQEDLEEYNVPLTDSLIEVINRINN